MRAGVYMGNFTFEVQDIPEPEPKGSEVKVQVAWCGLCGTDVHRYQGKNGSSVIAPPLILGHECSGIVVGVGPDCTRFKAGDRVACDPNCACGECEWCQKGLPHFCVNRHNVARSFTEYICPPQSNVYHVPDSLDLRSAALTEPLSCVIHGLDLIEPISGKNFVLFGMGSIGSLMLQLILLTGPAKVIVVEREAEKRERALRLGADIAVTDEEIEDICSEINADYVVECIGLTPTMEQAIRVAGKKSKVLLFGLGDSEKPVSFNQYEAYTKELSIYNSFINPNTAERAVALLASGRLNTSDIFSAELELEDLGEELATLQHVRRGKVIVRLSGEM